MALLPADVRLDVGLAECSICYEAYREGASGRGPKLLCCQHSLCLACLRRMVCRSPAFSFVVCPFCRTVTLVPEQGPQALRDDESLLRMIAPWGQAGTGPKEPPKDEKDATARAGRDSAPLPRDAEFNYGGSTPVFTVSSLLPAYPPGLPSETGTWGRFPAQEVRNTMLVGLPSRGCSQAAQPPPPSVENLRLGFALTIILLIVCVFFSLVFLK